MTKALKSWSGMRKYLEQEMLAERLRGRIRYNCTRYPGMSDFKAFEIFVDDACVKRFSVETVNVHLAGNGIGDSWLWCPLERRTEYTDEEFSEALRNYRNQDIAESLRSANPIERMFAILDRRVGKRTLEDVRENLDAQPDWLKLFYALRLKAEGLSD